MEDRTYRCEVCGMTSRLSAVDRQENLDTCPWCGEPLSPDGQGGPNENEENQSSSKA